MAATIAKAIGHDHVRSKYTHRLGAAAAEVEAATYQTFAKAFIQRDGSGYVRVTRGGRVFRYNFGPESESLCGIVYRSDEEAQT